MTADQTPSKYPYLISVRGSHRQVPARREGHYYVCAWVTFLGLYWGARDVKVLQYDPHRDFYREYLQQRQTAKTGAEPKKAATAPDQQELPTNKRTLTQPERRPAPPPNPTPTRPPRTIGR